MKVFDLSVLQSERKQKEDKEKEDKNKNQIDEDVEWIWNKIIRIYLFIIYFIFSV